MSIDISKRSIIMSMAYGCDTAPTNDPLVSAVEGLIALLGRSLFPGVAAILAAFPRYIHLAAHFPSWFPEANLKSDGVIGQKLAAEVLDVLFNLVKKNLVSTFISCLYRTNLFGRREVTAEFEDWPSLPYVHAVLRELLRWNPVVSSRAMSKDEDKYCDMEDFRPERFTSFMSDSVIISPFANGPVFGIGRRVCRFSPESFIFIAIVSILATFNITKAKGREGHEISVERWFTTGISVWVPLSPPSTG
ncbi:hypothetical protein F5I97DRAFT_1929597 [Phlebopus sp. FC_14]|nr:hypothetical protein F5I97DRAFT_1929597 [Phlebopus sp. FC_14]